MSSKPIFTPLTATYCIDFTDGTTRRFSCTFDPFTLNVSNIASSYEQLSDALTECEYLELPNGTIVDTFNDADEGRVIADGTMQDESSEMMALDYVMGTTKTGDPT